MVLLLGPGGGERRPGRRMGPRRCRSFSRGAGGGAAALAAPLPPSALFLPHKFPRAAPLRARPDGEAPPAPRDARPGQQVRGRGPPLPPLPGARNTVPASAGASRPHGERSGWVPRPGCRREAGDQSPGVGRSCWRSSRPCAETSAPSSSTTSNEAAEGGLAKERGSRTFPRWRPDFTLLCACKSKVLRNNCERLPRCAPGNLWA